MLFSSLPLFVDKQDKLLTVTAISQYQHYEFEKYNDVSYVYRVINYMH